MDLRQITLKRYKGYADEVSLDLAPLTILVGRNNSGKTALAQGVQLLAGGLTTAGHEDSEPLPWFSGGVRHGNRFEDLVTGRTMHGRLKLTAIFDHAGEPITLAATVRNVVAPPRPSQRQVATWQLHCPDMEVDLQRTRFAEYAPYEISISGRPHPPSELQWHGLLPVRPADSTPWPGRTIDALRVWALGVRHLQCPRDVCVDPFRPPDRPPESLGARGEYTHLVLAADDDLRASVRRWYSSTFGVSLDILFQLSLAELVVGAPSLLSPVSLLQSGRGLSHVLPVLVTALTAKARGPGLDIIEHPEAELHPGAHAAVAELLLENLVGPARPLLVETHSEMLLLRARRWIAEGRLAPRDLLIYWVTADSPSGCSLQKITIDDKGDLEYWPEGVFVEDYEEILAIRRAATSRA